LAELIGRRRFFLAERVLATRAAFLGGLFWIGNSVPIKPTGNQPRTPLVIGEVNAKSGLLRQETMRVIDERGDGDSPLLALSNFSAREDRETSEIIVNMSRLFERSPPEPERDWKSAA